MNRFLASDRYGWPVLNLIPDRDLKALNATGSQKPTTKRRRGKNTVSAWQGVQQEWYWPLRVVNARSNTLERAWAHAWEVDQVIRDQVGGMIRVGVGSTDLDQIIKWRRHPVPQEANDRRRRRPQ